MRRCDNCKRNLFCDSVWKTSGDQITSCVSWTPIITNADKIRAMADKELEEFMMNVASFGISLWIPKDWDGDSWLDWLREEGE